MIRPRTGVNAAQLGLLAAAQKPGRFPICRAELVLAEGNCGLQEASRPERAMLMPTDRPSATGPECSHAGASGSRGFAIASLSHGIAPGIALANQDKLE